LTLTQPQTAQTTGTLNVTDNGKAPWQYPKFNFIANGAYTSAPGAGIGAAIQGMEIQQIKQNTPGVQTSGNWQALTVAYEGTGGGVNDVFSGGFEGVIGLVNQGDGRNLSGYFIANNPSITIPAGFTPTAAYGEQIDNQVQAAPTFKAGLTIHDISNTVNGTAADAGEIVYKDGSGSVGWFDGLLFGLASGTFPIQAGGSFLQTTVSSVALDSFLDFSHMSSAPNTGGIIFPQYTHNAICFGAQAGGTCPGGAVGSGTMGGGAGALIFAYQNTAFQFNNVTKWNVDINGNETTVGTQTSNPVAISALPSCTVSTYVGARTAVNNGIASPTYHQAVSATGSTVQPVFCAGAVGWIYD
jgi:hypothetical protein